MTSPFSVAAPTWCRRVIIVGAGGFGREALQWASDAWPEQAGRIAGFLSADPAALDRHATRLPILGDPDTFRLLPGDGLVLAIGIPQVRRQVAERLAQRGANFLTLVHPTAIVAATATVGTGSVICPQAVVSDAAGLGRCVLVNYHASLGHDAKAGEYTVFSPYATLGGGAIVEEDVFLGLHATVGPRVRIGAGTKVSANSAALVSVPRRTLVYGVPGQIGRHVMVAR
jgi:sugar O-acyltransferase (sialic acid O-acetyltransferase NeuD family)